MNLTVAIPLDRRLCIPTQQQFVVHRVLITCSLIHITYTNQENRSCIALIRQCAWGVSLGRFPPMFAVKQCYKGIYCFLESKCELLAHNPSKIKVAFDIKIHCVHRFMAPYFKNRTPIPESDTTVHSLQRFV